MKKFVAVLLVSLCAISVFAQSGRSRPRVIVTDNTDKSQKEIPAGNSNSTVQTTTTTPAPQARRPPVLIGDTKSAPQPAATPVTDGSGDDEVIRVETNLVTIPVSVLDRDGRFIAGMRQQDFHIYEDGVEQKVEYFAPVEQPFTVVLLLDVSNSTEFKIEEIQDAAIAFINQLRPEDRVMVVAFDESVHYLSPITNNRAMLANAVRRAEFGGGTSLYEAVDKVVTADLERVEGRKAIVLFTDGVDTTSRRANYQSSVRDTEEADVLVYPIRFDTFTDMGNNQGGGSYPYPNRRGGGVLGQILGGVLNGGNVQIGNSRGGGGGSGTSRGEYETGRRYLDDLARTSGGRMFEARSLYNVDAAFSGIAEELRRQYSIGYYPANVGQIGQRKQIKVRTDRTNAVVRAKNSYIVGESDNKNNTANTRPKPTLNNSSRLPF